MLMLVQKQHLENHCLNLFQSVFSYVKAGISRADFCGSVVRIGHTSKHQAHNQDSVDA